jgi:phosphoribosylaminoimidazole (AIR) synthetase
MARLTYRDAGVDMAAGDAVVERIKPTRGLDAAPGGDRRRGRLRGALPPADGTSASPSW